ncbi:porin [Ramlibacter pallidus]|uniref:Porin n=1 Tax=Ramlibacter pallidus TaxID=2780087 RepID=A0ABR9S6U9_9BURK|nr:porin [Ramlibacter pallidus]MBE7369037.1 porin [Ramlibacter pallidus]
MKKCIAVLAAFASAGTFAQSRVSLSGLLDTAVTHVRTEAGGRTVSKTGMFGSGFQSNFLRFDGREDLGDGWYSTFRLEAGLNTDSGLGIASNSNNQRSGAGPAASAMTFNRWAYVGLGSNRFGEVRVGRVYTAAFENFTPYDPFFTNGVGSSTPVTLRLGLRNTQTALNVSNAIEYLTPGYGQGFFGRVTLALGENPSDGTLAAGNPRHAGDHGAVRIGYASGPWSVAFSAGLTQNTAGAIGAVNNQGDYLNTNLSARYDFGWVRVQGQYVTESLEGATAAGGGLTGNPAHEAKTRSLLLGAIFPVGPGNFKVSYIHGRLTDNIGNPAEKGQLIAVGYDYNLSKRTAIYTVFSHIDNNAVGNYGFPAQYVTTGRGESSQGFSVGMRHIF